MADALTRPDAQAPAGRTIIEPQSGWPPVNWRELWARRELLYFLAWRDVKVRYKQTVLGALWAILQPVLTMVVLTLIFQRLLGLGGRLMGTADLQYPYAIFLFAGLLPWQFFSNALKRGSDSVVGSAQLTQKVYFPRLVIPMASVGAGLLDFALSFLTLVVLMLCYGIVPRAAILLVLPLAVVTTCAALGVGAFLSALNVAYRDFRYVVPFLLQIWFYGTPLLWALGKAPAGWRLVLALNPMCGIVEAHRWAVLPDWPLDAGVLGVSAGVSLCLLVLGFRYFRRVERHFADII